MTDARLVENVNGARGLEMHSSVKRTVVAITISAVVAACSDSSTVSSPRAAAGPPANAQLFSTPIGVNAVTRDAPLDTALSASGLIGVFGGSITLPSAGLLVVVPPFAVTKPTLITVTAVAGRQVAYEFEPHGTQFLVPLLVRQSLSGTSAMANGALPSTLYAGYFADVANLDQLNGTALISELLGTSIGSWNGTVSFAVRHFSGYLIATGKTDPAEGDGSQ